MAKKTSYALKQLIPEENPKTGTKYIVRKPTKGMIQSIQNCPLLWHQAAYIWMNLARLIGITCPTNLLLPTAGSWIAALLESGRSSRGTCFTYSRVATR